MNGNKALLTLSALASIGAFVLMIMRKQAGGGGNGGDGGPELSIGAFAQIQNLSGYPQALGISPIQHALYTEALGFHLVNVGQEVSGVSVQLNLEWPDVYYPDPETGEPIFVYPGGSILLSNALLEGEDLYTLDPLIQPFIYPPGDKRIWFDCNLKETIQGSGTLWLVSHSITLTATVFIDTTIYAEKTTSTTIASWN